MQTPIEFVLSKLPDAKRSGNGWSARCPAHDDGSPSLSISEGDDGRILLHCHAGCAVEAIVEALGLRLTDLMPLNSNGGPRLSTKAPKPAKVYATANEAVAALESYLGKRSAMWTYHDANGEPIGIVVRWDLPDGKKDFRPVSKNGQGWIVGAMPEPRVLYCRNELGTIRRVYVCEGEKEADAARSIDLPTVTSVGGSTVPAKADWSPLAGRECIILPDNDAAGEGYKNVVGGILTKLDPPATVKVVTLPGLPLKGDMADFVEAHNSVEPEVLRQQVEAMADAAPVWKPETTTPLKLKRFQPFPINVLPEPVRGFVKAGAKALGCDATLIILPLLSALAAAVGATRRIRLKATWTEPAVIWAAVVAESGTLKSPSQNSALSVLKRLQAFKLQELPELEEQYQRDLALWESDKHLWKTKGRKAGEPPPEKPVEPTIERYIVSDITIEALADRLKDSPRGLLCGVDELAQWFGALDAYRGGRGGDAAKWLSIHRAESLIVDRKTGPAKTTYVPFAAVSLCGGIQPETLKRVLGSEHIENGLLARLLLAGPPRQSKKWTEATIHPEVLKNMERLFGRLLALSFGVNDDDQPSPIDVPLTPEGKAAWVVFYNEHAKAQSEQEGDLAAAFSKLEGYAARFALIVHLVRVAADDPSVDPEAVDAASVEAGATMARWFCNEAERVYSMFHESDESAEVRRLVEWVEARGGSVTAREVQQGHRRYKTASDAESALAKLVDAGLGQWETDNHDGGKGRPVARFVLSDSKPVYTSTVYTNGENPEENGNCVDVDSVDVSENTTPVPTDWGEV